MLSLVSICIPSYKHPKLIERALQSIVDQDYKNIEVIVSDDTSDDGVKIICNSYSGLLRLRYCQNFPALGSPGNWNNALNMANGAYLILLHHDDWLAGPKIISKCVSLLEENPDASFAFGKSMAIEERLNTSRSIKVQHINSLYEYPFKLFTDNIIGPPSNVIMRNIITERYNTNYRWLVDLEFYIRLILKGFRFLYIDEIISKIGVHPDQMTFYCMEDGYIIVKENIMLYKQYQDQIGSDIKIYDQIWRLVRNNRIRSVKDLALLDLKENEISPVIINMINSQSAIPEILLKNGIVSKITMLLSYARRNR